VKISKPYPYLYRDSDRHGRVRWRLRVPGRKTLTVKGQYGSPEFAANYRSAFEGSPVEPKGLVAKHGSMAALARTYLRSAGFAELAPATKKARRHLIETYIVGKWGDLPVAGLERKHIKLIMGSLARTPGTARNVLSMLRVLIAVAIDDGDITDDPTVGIKRPKLSNEGWHAWTEAEITQYEAHHPIGSQARLAFAQALYTGQRASDLIEMGRQHVRDGRISVRQHKTGTDFGYRCTRN
jgi:integrase